MKESEAEGITLSEKLLLLPRKPMKPNHTEYPFGRDITTCSSKHGQQIPFPDTDEAADVNWSLNESLLEKPYSITCEH